MDCVGVDSFACGFVEGSKDLGEFMGVAIDPAASLAVIFLAIFSVVVLIIVGKRIVGSGSL